MFKSLRNRLTSIFVGLAVLPLLGVVFFLSIRSFSTLEKEALTSQGEKAQLVAAKTQAFIDLRQSELHILTETQSLGDLPVNEQSELLKSVLAHEPSYHEFIMLDSSGQETLRVSRLYVYTEESLVSQAETAEYQQPVATGEIYFSPVLFDEAIQEPLMLMAYPLINLRSGEVDNVLLAELSLKSIWNLFASAELEGNEDVYMIDSTGRVIAHRNPSVVLRGTTFDLPDRQIRVPGLSSESVILATEQMTFGEQEFTVIAEKPYAEAASLATSLLTIAAIVTGMALIVAIVVGVLSVRQIVQPVEALSHTSKLISKGDLSQRVEITTQDELGELAQSFNTMATKLQTTLDRERLARREAQEANRLKDLFLATMSHELRTPLNAVIGFLGLMLFSGQLDEDNTHMAERSIANADRLLNLINNILDLSRITSGSLEITPLEMSPKQVAESIYEDLSIQVSEKKLEFTLEIDDTLPDTIIHDEERIIQIATNLVGNAVKFTETGGIHMAFRRSDDRLVLEVSDTGIGIPAAKHDLIFDEFTQVDSSSTRKHGGAGLGLAIVKRLTMLMDGSVRVKSEVGKGSTFTVEIPLELAPVETTPLTILERTVK